MSKTPVGWKGSVRPLIRAKRCSVRLLDLLRIPELCMSQYKFLWGFYGGVLSVYVFIATIALGIVAVILALLAMCANLQVYTTP